jgi:hypothetical protein
MLVILLYSWRRKWSRSSPARLSSFRRIYESRVNYCDRLDKAKKAGVFAPTVPKVFRTSYFGEDLGSHDGFFGWLMPAWEDIWIEIQSWKPGARLIAKQNERYVNDLA